MHEERLAKACSRGISIAQNELYERYSDVLYNICFRYAQDNSEADDFFQESFMLILKKMKKFKYQGEGSLKAWLIRLTINSCISYLRHKKRKIELTNNDFEDIAEEEDSIFFPENKYDIVSQSNFTQEDLMFELQRLPEKFKVVFNLFVIEEYKHSDIAKMLDINEKTSKTRLWRAKQMLKQQLYEKCLLNHN